MYPHPPPFPGAGQPPVSGAVVALVLGILSIVLCPLCGPIAWSIGRRAEQTIDVSDGPSDRRGLATAGKILGMIGTAFLLLLIAGLVALLATGGGTGGTSSA